MKYDGDCTIKYWTGIVQMMTQFVQNTTFLDLNTIGFVLNLRVAFPSKNTRFYKDENY